MTKLSDERLSELVDRLRVTDYVSVDQGFLFLELGKREGLRTGYPKLHFSVFEGNYFLDVAVPADHPDYDTRREITDDEMLIFAQVAKKKDPNSRLTKALVEKVKSILTDRKIKLDNELSELEETLRQLEN